MEVGTDMSYLFLVSAGILFVNGIPHFVQGLCGNSFQSPFAEPPGVGESSPVVNVIWGFLNLAGAGLIIDLSGFEFGLNMNTLLFALSGLLTGVFLAFHFHRVRGRTNRISD